MASSGLVTGMITHWGECLTICVVTPLMISKFFSRRSSRLIPGLRASPAVMTTTSELAVSA
jgi:hypothetical protein